MKISPKMKAMLKAYVRIFAATTLASYLTLGKAPLDLGLADLEALLNAGIGALVLLTVNYLRKGESRYGRGSENVGMGGDDALRPADGGAVQVPIVEGGEVVGDLGGPTPE